jgi:hypothetical protein
MFSQILGLAGSAISANAASRDAAAARADANFFRGRELDLANANFALAQDQRRAQREEAAYQRNIERMNRRIREDERRFQMEIMEDNKRAAMEQRRMDIERQLQEDREAARLSQFRLEQLLQNQDLRAEEREFAIEQLNEAKAVAAGERDEEMRRFLEDRATKEIERDFMIQQALGAQQTARDERAQDVALRNQIMAEVQSMQAALDSTAANLGYVPMIDPVTQSEIDAQTAQFTQDYMGDVDRAADRVASVNEANLIRRGIDESTPGTARRGEVAERIANEYNQARRRAATDALAYVTGSDRAMRDSISGLMNQRKGILSEAVNVAGASIAPLTGLPGLTSAVDSYRLAQLVPSGILDRNIGSANNFAAPVSIGSSVYDTINTLPALADYNPPTSLVSNEGYGIQSAIFNPYNVSLDSNDYMGNALNTMSGLTGRASSFADNMAKRSTAASQGFGSQFNKFLNDQSQGAQYGIKGMVKQPDGTFDPQYGQTSDPGAFYNLNNSMNNWFSGLFGG